MKISLQQDFGGIIPRLAAEFAPQAAHNIELRGGVLSPISVSLPFSQLHDGTDQLQGFPSDEIATVAKPDHAPVKNALGMMAVNPPETWISFVKVFGGAYAVNVLGVPTFSHFASSGLEMTYKPGSLQYNDVGFSLIYTIPNSGSLVLTDDKAWYIYGPVYQIKVMSDEVGDWDNGGPTITITDPEILDSDADNALGLPTWHPILVELKRDGRIYGTLELVDVRGPRWGPGDGTTITPDTDLGSYPLTRGDVRFTFRLNYAEQTYRNYLYLTTNVTAGDVEGPPSDISDMMQVKPGERHGINEIDGNGKKRIYRSVKDSDKFCLVGEIEAGSAWEDTGLGVQEQIELPEYGNYNEHDGTAGVSTTNFLVGAFIHPGRFAVAKYGATIYVSDIDRYHAFPGDWTVDFEDGVDGGTIVAAHALVGETIIVFTWENGGAAPIAGKVWALSGSDPANLRKYLLSQTAPLLDPRSICAIDGVLYWVSHNGVFRTTGSSVEVESQEYTREQWALLIPGPAVGAQRTLAKTSGESVFLEFPDATDEQKNLRIDIGEGQKRVSTWDDTTGAIGAGEGMIWHSPRKRLDRETIIDIVKVDASGNPPLKIYSYGPTGAQTEAYSGSPEANKLVRTNIAAHAREWDAKVDQSSSTVRDIELYGREVVSVDGGVMRFTPENVELWENLWIKFPNKDRPVAGSLSAQNAGGSGTPVNAVIDFYTRVGTGAPLLAQQTVTSGRFFSLDRSTLASDYWLVVVRKTGDAEGGPYTPTQIEELILCTRIAEKTGETIHIVASGGIPEWLYKSWDFGGTRLIKSVMVATHQDVGVRMRGYLDGAGTQAVPSFTTPALTSRVETVLSPGRCSALEFDFISTANTNPADDLVRELFIRTEIIQPVGDAPVTIDGGNGWVNNAYKFEERGSVAGIVVGASNYGSSTVAITKDGSSVMSASALSAIGRNFCPLARVAPGAIWNVNVAQNVADELHYIRLYPRTRIQAPARLHLTNQDSGGFGPWLHQIYEVPDRIIPKSLIVHASATVYMEAYFDGSLTNSLINDEDEPVRLEILGKDAVGGGDEMRLAWARCSSVEFAFFAASTGAARADHLVQELVMHSLAMRDIGGPVTIDDGPWVGNLFKFPDRGKFAAFSIGFTEITTGQTPAPTATITLYRDGAAQDAITVSDGNLHWFPRTMAEGAVWEVGVASAGQLFKVLLLPLERVPAPSKSLILKGNDTGVMPWAATDFEFEKNSELVSGIVKADTYPIYWKPYKDGSVAGITAIAIADAAEFVISGFGQCSSLAMRFFSDEGCTLDADYRVNEAMFFHKEVRQIPSEGIVIRDWVDKPNARALVFEFPVCGALSSMRLVLSDYTGAEVKFYADGVLAQTVNPANDAEFRLDDDFPDCRRLGVDAARAAAADIHELHLFGRHIIEVKNGRLEIKRAGDPFSWRAKRILSLTPISFRAGQVWAERYPVTLALRHGNNIVLEYPVQSSRPFSWPRLRRAREMQLDIPEADAIIVHSAALATSMDGLKG